MVAPLIRSPRPSMGASPGENVRCAAIPCPFQDAYAVANGAGTPVSPLWCIRREDGGVDLPEGCTFGVTPIHDPLGGDLEPARIDDLFVHGASGIVQSRVVFTPYPPAEAE